MTKRLPLAFLAILLIVLLAGLGVAYGLWSETLTISGTVNTGEVDVGFSGPWVAEWVEVNGTPQLEPKGKDEAAKCYATAIDSDLTSDGKETIKVTVKGAYPSYHCLVKFDISNLGTVPVHISRPKAGEGTPSWVKASACYPEWYQLHAQEKAWASILIHFTNKDGVNENSEYTFTFTIEARQWNEAPATVNQGDTTCFAPPEGIEPVLQQ
ncbi:MAG: hypothetical protein ACPLUL_13285 [Thermanaerothrix sp.]|uniref:hypothetical protein n=1 Tax=Thermanaerothrix sp. TaxID=2972675 RepID=UPI003C7A3BF9